jgi:hypothetical protein
MILSGGTFLGKLAPDPDQRYNPAAKWTAGKSQSTFNRIEDAYRWVELSRKPILGPKRQ